MLVNYASTGKQIKELSKYFLMIEIFQYRELLKNNVHPFLTFAHQKLT